MIHPQRIQQRRRRSGYTLLEIMFSILILGVGMAAVASLFPFAAHIQQNTMHELMAQQTKTNIVTLLHGKGFSQADVLNAALHEVPGGSAHITNTTRFKLSNNVADSFSATFDPADPNQGEINKHWPLQDRSYPTTIANLTQRSIFWEPLFYRAGNEWRVMVVIMRRHGKLIPRLAATPLTKKNAGIDNDYKYDADQWLTGSALEMNRLKLGSKVIDQFGNIYSVTNKTYLDGAGAKGQNATPYAVEVSPKLPTGTTSFTFWHVSSHQPTGGSNTVAHHGEILEVVTLGNEVLK